MNKIKTKNINKKIFKSNDWIFLFLFGFVFLEDQIFTKRHKGIINTNKLKLVDNILPAELLNQLQSKRVLKTSEIADIKRQGPKEKQVEKLLEYIVCKADSAFYDFIKALHKSSQKHIAMVLEKADGKVGCVMICIPTQDIHI